MTHVDKWSGANPWLGLASYSEKETLYGRDKETTVLSYVIKNNIATTLFGKSGVGKSSLISAGISHVLNKDMYVPVKIRLVHNSDVAYIEQIENAVREKVVCTDNLPSTIKDLGLWDFFHRHSFTTVEGEDCTPVVILDQFEEMFTLTDEEHKPRIREFFQDLSSLLNNIKPDNVKEIERQHNVAQTPVSSVGTKKLVIKRVGASVFQYSESVDFRFVVCLREDKLYLLERNSANIPALKSNRFNLQALSVESAMEVITRPRPGLFSEKDAQARIDELADMGDEGTYTIDPAILSLYMYKYYEKRGTASTSNIFADYYNEATKEISEKSIAYLEEKLLTDSGYRNQVPLDDALSNGVTRGEIDALLKSVILRTEKRRGIDYIEFSHDRLSAEAKKSREERNTREQAKKIRVRMLIFILIFVVSLVCFLISYKKQLSTIEEQQRIIEILNNKSSIEEISIKDNIAGRLAERLPYNALTNVTTLIITGDIDGTDIVYIQNAAQVGKLKHLDLSNVAIVNGGNSNGNFVFSKSDSLETVSLPPSIEHISPYAFEYCKKLKKIIIPNNVTSIKEYAFYGCENLTSIELPNSLISIESHAFEKCGLKSITIPESVTKLEFRSFSSCYSLSSITIPNNVIEINIRAFEDCGNLTSIKVDKNNKYFDSRNNCNAIIMSSTNELIRGCKNTVIPNSVTSIGDYAFSNCRGLKSIKIPNGVTKIGRVAFSYCDDLTSILLPNSLTLIKDYAFEGCKALEYITIPNSNTVIGSNLFKYCTNLSCINCYIENFRYDNYKLELYGMPEYCKWHVPKGKKSVYTSQQWWEDKWTIEDDLNPSYNHE